MAQFGREGLNKIKRERLRSVLDMASGVSKKSVPWILHKWDVNTHLKDDPMEVGLLAAPEQLKEAQTPRAK